MGLRNSAIFRVQLRKNQLFNDFRQTLVFLNEASIWSSNLNLVLDSSVSDSNCFSPKTTFSGKVLEEKAPENNAVVPSTENRWRKKSQCTETSIKVELVKTVTASASKHRRHRGIFNSFDDQRIQDFVGNFSLGNHSSVRMIESATSFIIFLQNYRMYLVYQGARRQLLISTKIQQCRELFIAFEPWKAQKSSRFEKYFLLENTGLHQTLLRTPKLSKFLQKTFIYGAIFSIEKCYRGKNLCFLIQNCQIRHNFLTGKPVSTFLLRILCELRSRAIAEIAITHKLLSEPKCLEERKLLRFTLQMKITPCILYDRFGSHFWWRCWQLIWSTGERKQTSQASVFLWHCPNTLSHDTHKLNWVQQSWRQKSSIAAVLFLFFKDKIWAHYNYWIQHELSDI